MSNNNLFRLAGWSAILSIVLTFGMFGVAGAAGRGTAFAAMSIVTSIITAVVFLALYIFHRDQSAVASLAMLACGVVGLVLENFGAGPGSVITAIAIAVYGVAYLLIGYLGYGSPQMPRWLASVAYVVGVFCLAFTAIVAIGMEDTAGYPLLMLQVVAWIVWSAGIARLFLSGKILLAKA